MPVALGVVGIAIPPTKARKYPVPNRNGQFTFPSNLYFMRLFPLLVVWCWACADSAPVDPTPSPTTAATPVNTVETVIADMTEPHEGYARGVNYDGGEAWSWVYHPRIGYGNTPPDGWNAFIPWGQVYADTSGITTANVRFELRNLQGGYLSKADHQWHQWSGPDPIIGANYAEDFADDENIEADIRPIEGGISSTIVDGYNFHFFHENRVEIDPTDIAGVWTFFEGRVVQADPNGPDNRREAHLLASVGGDYWLSKSAAWDQWTTNGDVGIGRFKYLTPEWRAFNMHTLTAEQIQRHPPPVE